MTQPQSRIRNTERNETAIFNPAAPVIPNFLRGFVPLSQHPFHPPNQSPEVVPQAGPGWKESNRRRSPISSQDLEGIRRGPWLEIHQNLVLYVLQNVRLADGWTPSNKIARLSKHWAKWDVLTSLANYRFVVQTLFEYLKDSSNLFQVSATDVFDRLSQDITCVIRRINSLLSDRTTYKHFVSCRGMIAQQLLDLLQDLLDSSHELRSRPLISKALLRLSGECGLHPTCFPLFGLKKVGQQVAGGGFGDICKGLVGGQTVAVKSMRQFMDDDVKATLKKLGREALIWRQLSHPNLLPFFGLYILHNRPSLISPWMDDGDLKHFLNNAPSKINRVALITDVAMGLEHLHINHVVHGDLKTANILVTPSGRACITDFGLSSIVDELSLKMMFSGRSGKAGTARYQAPELLANERPNHFGSDVYAFACVCYEILTRRAPFFEIANEMVIAIKVMTGARPSRPRVISPGYIWNLVDDCWRQKAEERPTTAVILQRLRQPIGETPNQSPPDWDDQFSAKFRRSIQEWPLLPSITEIERRISSNRVDDAVWVALENFELADNSGIDRDEDISWNDRIAWTEKTSPPPRELLPPSPPSPTVGDLEPTEIHPWLSGWNSIHLDLATTAFAPLRRMWDDTGAVRRIQFNIAELRESAFHPPLTVLRFSIVHRHPRIAFWPIDVKAAAESSLPITIGDVLVSIHQAMHRRVSSACWAFLDEEQQRAVAQAFAARCRAEARHDYSQEIAIRNEGLKRVDFLQGKTFFKGLQWDRGVVYLQTGDDSIHGLFS